MDAATKKQVHEDLLAHLRRELPASSQASDEHQDASELDQDVTFSSDDQSQSDAAGVMSGLLDDAAIRAAQNVEAAEALDMAPTKTVGPGAIVAVDGVHYVVGVVTDAFESGGASYEGMSTDSPVYQAIEGLEEGAEFTFNDKTQRLELVA